MKVFTKFISIFILTGYIGSFLYCADAVMTVEHHHDADCGLINKVLHSNADSNQHSTTNGSEDSDGHNCHCPCHSTLSIFNSHFVFSFSSLAELMWAPSAEITNHYSVVYQPPELS